MRFDKNLFDNLNLKISLNLLIIIRSRDFFALKILYFYNKFYNEFITFSSIFRIINKYSLIDFFRKTRIIMCVLIMLKLLRYKSF